MNKEALKNSYQRFVEEGIILVAKGKEKGSVAMMRLAPEWMPQRDPTTDRLVARGRLWDFIELIAQSRREGYVNNLIHPACVHANKRSKNRRDGATVSSRVLTMSDLTGRKMFANTKRPEQTGDVDVSTRSMRRNEIEPSAKL